MKKIIVLLALVAISLNSHAVSRMNRDVNLPFTIAVSGPLLPDMETGSLSPASVSVGTTEETIWSEGGNYQFLAVATLLSVASSSANDTSAGTGLQTLEVECLDINYISFKETVIMNGQTEVAMSANCFRVQGNGMVGRTAGSIGSNDGTIYIGHGVFTTGKPANVLGLIDPSENISRFGIFTVPANHSLLVTQFSLSNSDNQVTEMVIFVRPENGLFIRGVSFDVKAASIALSSIAPQRVVEKTDIELRASTAAGVADIKVLFSYMLGVNI